MLILKQLFLGLLLPAVVSGGILILARYLSAKTVRLTLTNGLQIGLSLLHSVLATSLAISVWKVSPFYLFRLVKESIGSAVWLSLGLSLDAFGTSLHGGV